MQLILVYVLNILVLISAGYWFSKRAGQDEFKRHFGIALSIKMAGGILLGLLFHNFYQGGDTIVYYQKAEKLVNLDTDQFLSALLTPTIPSQQVRAIYFVRIVALLKWLTHGDYWILGAYFSFFSFLGSGYLTSQLIRWNRSFKWPTLVAFLYFPSIVFWSSGLLKDSLVYGAMCVLLGIYVSWKISRKINIPNLLLAAFCLVLIGGIKYYIAAILVPMLVYLVGYHLSVWHKYKIENFWQRTAIILLIMLVPGLLFLNWLSPNLHYGNVWSIMQYNHLQYLSLSPENALQVIKCWDNSGDILLNIPYLWFSAIFRPLLWENFTFPAILAGLENLILFVGAVVGLWQIKRVMWTAELLSLIAYVSVLAIFLGYSAPNFGTLARFKIYYMPFAVFMITYCLSIGKFSIKKLNH